MQSPFKFLDSYTKDDRNIFFGRDREIEELYQRVFESKIVLVYGVSGTGKSSLIHCGLANKFSETDWLPVNIRRGTGIIQSMASAVSQAAITPIEGTISTPSGFKKAVRSLYLDHYKPLYFIFDQFEELFIFGNREERKEFIAIVKALTESDLQCRFIFVMREEYMAGITEFEKYIPTVFSNRVRIEKMSHRNALETIKQPCKIFNISLEEGFAETLLEKLSPGETEVELTFLQVFLDKTYRLAVEIRSTAGGEHPSFTISLLEKVGNVSDLLGGFLDEQIAMMEYPDNAMSVLKAFVSGKGTKRPASEQEVIDNIRSIGKEIPQEQVIELIQSFVRLRVLRDKNDNGRYELRHDALAEKVYDKFSTAEKELLEIRQFIENSFQSYLKRKVLLNSDDLDYIANKDSQLNLNTELNEFILKSRKHQKATKKTVKILTLISATAFILLLSTLGYTISKRTKTSQSVQFAYETGFQYQFTRPIDQLCLASASWQAMQSEEAKGALLSTFNNLIRYPGEESEFNNLRKKYLVEFKPVSSTIEFAKCSKKGNFIYGHTNDSVFVWNMGGDLLYGFDHGSGQIIFLLMNDDETHIGSVNNDSILTIRNLDGKIGFTRKIEYNPVNRAQIFRFTRDDKVLTIAGDNEAHLIDINGNTIQSFRMHSGNINALDISDDNLFIATASSDNLIGIWHLRAEGQEYELYNTLTDHNDTVWSVDFANNSRYIVSASNDGAVKVFSVNNEMVFDLAEEYIYVFIN
ncbi:MAG: hypothetical protein R6W67_06585, partial [Bacteroidales bacterium]